MSPMVFVALVSLVSQKLDLEKLGLRGFQHFSCIVLRQLLSIERKICQWIEGRIDDTERSESGYIRKVMNIILDRRMVNLQKIAYSSMISRGSAISMWACCPK